MIPFHKFKKEFNKTLYSLNDVNDDLIILIHNKFTDNMIESENIAINMLKESTNIPIPDDVINIIRGKSDELDLEYDDIIKQTLDMFFEEMYSDNRLDKDGMCLKSQLIGKACQMKFNDDMLGVVREIDENNHRFLFVDFGDEAEVKIDIDELIISGQKL